MQIRNLFQKDLFRPINGVVKADQLDGESVWQELDEYVVTKELDQHLRGFFSAYLNAIDNPKSSEITGKVGVWVSGFFGSGKSHFIKILSYLLENREVATNGSTKKAVEFFDGKIVDASLYGDMKRAVHSDTDVILFNIDSKADSTKNRDAILSVFLKVFNDLLGYSGDHPVIADMERYLESKGKLDTFYAAYKEVSGSNWLDERDAYHFKQDELTAALSKSLEQSIEASTKWLENAEQNFTLNIDNFVKWVKEYLEKQGPKHRIIFLVDEIGQYIGDDTHLMLSLQTITERLGTECEGRAWVVVTSQEDIDAVIGEVKASKANDFSKIQGRFKTRLSLSSSNTDEVIQARLLDKTPDAKTALAKTYGAKGDILKHQLSFSNTGMTFKNFKDEEDFIANYPFAPYQFQLVQKVFETIRKAGATGLHLSRGERSMLDAFQLAGKQIADGNVGSLVPFYLFYPSIESFLDTAVKRTIDQAGDNTSLQEFDINLLRTLFLIRYVDEMKGNIDNLVTLCVDEIDADRLALKKNIEESLQRLENQTLISHNGDNFFFLTNEERDISREIKGMKWNAGEDTKFLGELIFDDVLKGQKKHRFEKNKKDFPFNRLCDSHAVGIQNQGDLTISVISPLGDEYEYFSEAKCIGQSTADGGQVIIKLKDDLTLGKEIRTFIQTQKFISRKNDGTLPATTQRILQERASENRDRRVRLTELLEKMLLEAEFFCAGQTITPKGANGDAIARDALDYLIENSFGKLSYLTHLVPDPQREIKATLAANDISAQTLQLQGGEGNPKAVDEVRKFINLSTDQHHEVVVDELVKKYARRPYGWPENETLLILARMIVLGEVSLVTDSTVMPLERIGDTLVSPRKLPGVKIIRRRTVDSGLLQAARKLGQDVFSKMGPDGEDELYTFLREKLMSWQHDLNGYKHLADGGEYPGKNHIDDALILINKLLSEHDSYDFIERFNSSKAALLDLSDNFHDLHHFYTIQKPTWDGLRRAIGEFEPNRKELEKDVAAADALRQIGEILKAASPYKLISNAEKLIQTVRNVNGQVLDNRRQHAIGKIDAHIEAVKDKIEGSGVSGDVSHTCLSPLQNAKKQIENETSIAQIFMTQNEASDLMYEAFERLDAEIATIEAKKKGDDKPIPTPAKIKKVVKPSQMVNHFLETEEEVDEFVEKLRRTLKDAISNNQRIQIQ
ncbi:BREX system P-loop protein BrxC [Magnetovibrio blakemorei]|uniref:ATPase n=1 Tax=Magnetovibrio blakemorei TaxID=28181 RepID=A0A1E5Q4S6_9PROT|nr:BREX system P-loop protein BrxC [Magnetovibrio blakemorei]OEJ64563.1 hypothetical protein BEN30_16170 [Magnetovibrio blakemorei]